MGNTDSTVEANEEAEEPEMLPGGLHEDDLDRIYEFVSSVKDTNVGRDMLNQFALKQSSKVERSDSKESLTPRTIVDNGFPIKTIEIRPLNGNDASSSKAESRPTASLNA
jgi:hypothetical protein